jgi:pimeloyl-ACP methyl ester carboxylesterase
LTSRPKKSGAAKREGETSARRTRSMAVMGAFIRGVDRLSPKLGARVAARVFMSPRRARVPEREAAWLGAATPEIFEAGRFRLSGHRWSKRGEPVLLIHGWEGRGSQLGALALAIAEAGLQPVTIDLPAHGSTNGARTHLLEFAEATGAMVRHLGGVAGIVAHSFGAAGVTVAMRESLPVRRVAYLAPAEDFGHYPRVFGQWLGLSAQLGDRMRDQIEGRIGVTMAELRGGLLAPKMRAPLLVVHDEDDVDVPWRDGQSYADAWPGAGLMTTRGLGHRRILRDPAVLSAVAAFLAEGGPKRAAGPSNR